MWICDYGPVSGSWWGGFFPGSLFLLLLWGLILLVLLVIIVYIVIRLFRSQTQTSQVPFRDRSDSEAILKARFAKGEISREEFIKMRQTLSQQ